MKNKRKILTYLICASMLITNTIHGSRVLASEMKNYEIENNNDLEIQTDEHQNSDDKFIWIESNDEQDVENTKYAEIEEVKEEIIENQDENCNDKCIETELDIEQQTQSTECIEIEQIDEEVILESQDEVIESDIEIEEDITENIQKNSEEDEKLGKSEIETEIEEIVTDIEIETVDNEKVSIEENNILDEKENTLLGGKDVTSGSYGNIVWTVDDNGKLIIEGTGEFSDSGKAPWAGDTRTGAGGNVTSVEVKVTDITSTAGMFWGLHNVTDIDLSGLDTSKVTDMSNMFYECSSLTNIDLSGLDTSKVTNMSGIFQQCSNLISVDISNCDTSNVTDMSKMFYNCQGLEKLDLSMLDTKNVTDMSEMFSKCRNLKQVNLVGINTENVITMREMFYDCNSLEEFDLSILNTKNLKYMNNMFTNCNSLKKLDFSSLNLDNTSCSGIISGCSSLSELNLGNIKPFFSGCSSLKALDLRNYDTKKYVDMSYMFYKCNNLEILDISSFDTSNVVNMKDMFYECKKLKNLDLSNFDMSKVITGENKVADYSVENMLYGCESLETIHTPCNLSEYIHIVLPIGTGDVWYREDGTKITELPQGLDYSIIIKKNEIPNQVKKNYTLNCSEKKLYVGEKFTLIVLDEEKEQYTNEIIWTSSDNKIAEVSTSGEVSGISKGTTIITATMVDGTLLQCEVSVDVNEEEKDEVEDEVKEDGLYIEDILEQTYTGKAVKPQLKIYYSKVLLTQGTDYILSYKNNVKAGSAVVTVKGKGNLSGQISKTFEIIPKNINDSDIAIENIAYNYDNKPHKKAPTITYNGKVLKEGKDFQIEYGAGDYISEGKYSVTIKGIGNFAGIYTNAKIIITDKSKNISKAKISKLPIKSYDKGNAIVLSENELVVTMGKNILKYNTDYKVNYFNNINVGKATVIIHGIGKYEGSKKVYFNIKRQQTILSDSMVKNKKMFDAIPIVKGGCMPEPLLQADGETLVENIDYTLSYKNNKKVGAATVIIKGKGVYKGTIKIPFIITTKPLTSNDILIRLSDKPYIGKAGKYMSNPIITDSDGKLLKLNKDFVVESYTANGELLNKKSNPENGTKITVRIKGKGAYTGSITESYMLRGIDISKAQIKIKTKDYTGNAVEISDKDITKSTIKSGKINKNLILGKDYEIAAYYNNVKKGTATVIFRGIGEYSGEKSVKFKIGAWRFWN